MHIIVSSYMHKFVLQVTASDIVNAEKFFGTLAHMTTSQLPQARLFSLLGESKLVSLIKICVIISRQ